ncbi:hypothetical protein P3X46_030527 [Hevea brasiliensis]|uniref:Uncharacterized protein n=1 Tax=Hevea brasiliensis TaxID=3981 RepID=A0ABQ9KHK6_HEVBR|nr:hypothetical protein P3X46_030527 [Hevea brasiliensis]
MCDLSGTGLMAVSTHFDIPFISKRTPEWLKKIFATATKSERNGPVFRFFVDLGDAVAYVKRLNIPSGVVGACRLDLAYEHFKEKPHLFQFVPNEKQMGHPGIPLSVISKAAEIQLLYAVDRVLLGNRWLRKATGIQPKFPYMVDSFEKRGVTKTDLQLPFGDWFRHPWLKQKWKPEKRSEIRSHNPSNEYTKQKLEPNPFLPKITMVGTSTGEAGQMSKASLKKTREDLTRELEQTDRENAPGSSNELEIEDRDPLFVANVGDCHSGMSRKSSSRWVRGGSNRKASSRKESFSGMS